MGARMVSCIGLLNLRVLLLSVQFWFIPPVGASFTSVDVHIRFYSFLLNMGNDPMYTDLQSIVFLLKLI